MAWRAVGFPRRISSTSHFACCSAAWPGSRLGEAREQERVDVGTWRRCSRARSASRRSAPRSPGRSRAACRGSTRRARALRGVRRLRPRGPLARARRRRRNLRGVAQHEQLGRGLRLSRRRRSAAACCGVARAATRAVPSKLGPRGSGCVRLRRRARRLATDRGCVAAAWQGVQTGSAAQREGGSDTGPSRAARTRSSSRRTMDRALRRLSTASPGAGWAGRELHLAKEQHDGPPPRRESRPASGRLGWKAGRWAGGQAALQRQPE